MEHLRGVSTPEGNQEKGETMSEESITAFQQQLISKLKETGALKSAAVEQAFLAAPRHLFLPGEPLERAYSDIAIAVKYGPEGQWTSSSSQPAIMAIMLEQLDLHPGQRVLEIGAGTGFNAALIACLVGREGQVTTVDIQPDLIDAARQHLEAAGFGWVETVAGDGGYGHPAGAPYDRIILTVSSAVIAPAWREQLSPGGRLVLPLSIGGPQVSVAFERRGEELSSVSISDCGFMPLQGAFSGPQMVHAQLGPDARLAVVSPQELPCGADLLAEWLAGYHANSAAAPAIPSGVQITEGEVGALVTWLAIHHESWGQLSADGDLAAGNHFPPLLYACWGDHCSMVSVLLALPDGAAVLSRPPGWEIPSATPGEGDCADSSQPFDLNIRSFGHGDPAAQRLLEIVRAWEQAGKPTSARLHLRALPAEMVYQAQEGEIVLERPWMRFVLWYE